MQLRHRVDREQWQLYLYDKIVSPQENLVEIDEHNFVACTGTLIYRNTIGVDAMRRLFDDFRNGVNVDKYLLGHYFVILFLAGRLIVFNDRNGYYRTYHDTSQHVFSSSFLAVQESLPTTTVSPHELYEYIFYGYFFGSQTLFKEIQILNRDFFWNLQPQIKCVARSSELFDNSDWNSFDDCLEDVRSNLLDYFQLLGGQYNSFACALSGGYDSRLIVALLRKLKIPSYYYVYGDEQSEDVRVAKSISAGEHFAVEHVNRSDWPTPDLDHWRQEVTNQFYFFDGANAGGIFDNGSDYATRVQRCKKSAIQLNGGGGEIYRETWNIGNRNIRIDQCLHNQYDFGYFGFCSERFDRAVFFDILKQKVQAILGTTSNELSRVDLEVLMIFLRTYFQAANVVINNQLAPALLPYVEPKIAYQSFQIPVSFKFQGRFQAALIRSIDPAIAKYNSAYGWDFSGEIPFMNRLRRDLQMHSPIWMRVLNRRRRQTRLQRPALLNGDYLHSIFQHRPLAIMEFLDPDKICEQTMLARAYSAELVIGSHLS